MRNHVHLIAVPDDCDSLPEAMSDCLERYALAFNRRNGRTGPLWNRRCHASMIQQRYLWAAIRYVERNPVRARIAERAEDYPWSSAAYHCGVRDDDPLVSTASPLKGALGDWSSWLEEPDLDGRLVYLRRKASEPPAGRPAKFIGQVDQALDRRITRKTRRPKG
jgi:putative transposase